MIKKNYERVSYVERRTKETQIKVNVNLDGNGLNQVKTGLPFFDHMIQQLSKHSLINICLLYTSPSPRDRSISRMPSSA